MSLRLHEAPHHAERHQGLTTRGASEHGGNYGVVGPLAGLKHVRVAPFQRKIEAPVLKGEPALFRDYPRSETHVVAVDEAAQVAMAIGGGEVDGVAPRTERVACKFCLYDRLFNFSIYNYISLNFIFVRV